MIDVEAGKEDLFGRLYTNLTELKDTQLVDKIQILYLAKCFNHSDISLLMDVKDTEALPPFIANIILQMDGVWDLQVIPLLNPNFFTPPINVWDTNYNNYSVTLDIKAEKTKTVFNQLKKIEASDLGALTFLAYSFSSYENDILLSFLSSDIAQAGKFVQKTIRTIDGVIDTFLWQIEEWKFIVAENEWMDFVKNNQSEDLVDIEEFEKSFRKIMDSYITAI
jgi:DNA-binding Lrp family transcriptional regulator